MKNTLAFDTLDDRRYQRLWGLPETAPESRPPDPKPPALGRFSQPAPCIHCTTSLLLPGVQCCRICLDRIPA